MKRKMVIVKIIKVNQLIKIISKQKKVAVQMTTAIASHKNGHKNKINRLNLNIKSQISINSNRIESMKIND